MQINLSRANFYLVDDTEYIVAVNAKQASEFYCEQVGEDYEPEVMPINPEKEYLIDIDTIVNGAQKLRYLNQNRGVNIRYQKPLKVGTDEITMNDR